jgi:hypothetical protein
MLDSEGSQVGIGRQIASRTYAFEKVKDERGVVPARLQDEDLRLGKPGANLAPSPAGERPRPGCERREGD